MSSLTKRISLSYLIGLIWNLSFVIDMVFASSLHSCCTRITQSSEAQVSFPGQTDYASTVGSYWSLQEASLTPACIVRPLSSLHVSQTLSVISASEGCFFAIKGQGHSPAAGFANSNGGVTLDMTSLNNTRLNSDLSVASVGAGSSWLDVYRYLDLFNISVPGGRNGLVGVGGLTLGGGISHFSPRVGWTCDSVVNYEIVLANGTLISANETSHGDLYRALKGGGNNFGVVTRFDLATFPQGDVSSTTLVHGISERRQVFDAFTSIASSPDFDVHASLVTGLLFNSSSNSWLISSSCVYTKPVLQPSVFAELISIPSISNVTKLISVAALADEQATPPLNWQFATATFNASAKLMNDIFGLLNETLYSFNPPGGIVWDIAFEPLPSAMLSHAEDKGGNILGLHPERDSGFILLLSALWPNSSVNSSVNQTAHKTLSQITSHAETEGLLHRFQYLNYAAPYQRPFISFGIDNLEFLRSSSRKYDPSGLFQKQAPGGFKLW